MPLATIEEQLPHADAFVYGSIDEPFSEREYHSYLVAPSSFLTEDSIDEYNANANRRCGPVGKSVGLVLAMALTLLALWGREHATSTSSFNENESRELIITRHTTTPPQQNTVANLRRRYRQK